MFTYKRAFGALRHPRRAWQWLFSHDYASPNLTPLPGNLFRFFPQLQRTRSWNSLVAHSQRFDRRFPEVGVVSWDESTLLYNYARQLQGQDLLEIGCWIGWSTVLLGLGGCRLTVIDPVLAGTPPGEACRESLRQAGLADSVKLIGGYSPGAVEELTAQGCKWSAGFIDGNHEGVAPLHDTQAFVCSARGDCLILFHDVILPNIAEALTWLGREGWNVGVHHTCFFIGVAWRGSARPLRHIPDPKVDWDGIIQRNLPHLSAFPRL